MNTPYSARYRIGHADNAIQHKGVTFWLLFVCGLIFCMALIGAITRLTESGLSIMEWAPIKGSLPPLSQIEWTRLFDLYKETDEFKVDNASMDLAGFKSIFWWEWIHRFWGRAMGLVFGLGLVWFWTRGKLPRWIKPHLLFALVLGGLQGTVGWFMVASGFDDGLTDVSHFRLAAHLLFALVLYGYLLVLALRLGWPRKGAHLTPPIQRRALWLGFTVLCVTIFSGALVAGLNAGKIFGDWPLMGGTFLPYDYVPEAFNWLRATLNHDSAVQFNHRWLATGLGVYTAVIAVWAIKSRKPDSTAKSWLVALALLVCGQVILGIVTLIYAVPTSLGAAHQGGAIGLLTAYIGSLYFMRRQAYKT